MSAVPEIKFGFSSEYVPLSLLDYITWGGQSFLLIVMIFIFFFHIASKRKEIRKQRGKYDFSLYTLKYISVLSILFGLSIFLYITQKSMKLISLAGSADWAVIAGPLGQALIPLVFGMINATVGFAFYYFAKWRNIRALESAESAEES